jgi:hypothetical protein
VKPLRGNLEPALIEDRCGFAGAAARVARGQGEGPLEEVAPLAPDRIGDDQLPAGSVELEAPRVRGGGVESPIAVMAKSAPPGTSGA